jgi:hypothetical protein
LELSKGKRVSSYTESKYAFLILHTHAAIWKEQEMLTAAESSVKYSQEILALLDAALLSKQVSVIHCSTIKREMILYPEETKPLMRLQKGKHEGIAAQSSPLGGIPDSSGKAPLPARGHPTVLNPRWSSDHGAGESPLRVVHGFLGHFSGRS